MFNDCSLTMMGQGTAALPWHPEGGAVGSYTVGLILHRTTQKARRNATTPPQRRSKELLLVGQCWVQGCGFECYALHFVHDHPINGPGGAFQAQHCGMTIARKHCRWWVKPRPGCPDFFLFFFLFVSFIDKTLHMAASYLQQFILVGTRLWPMCLSITQLSQRSAI